MQVVWLRLNRIESEQNPSTSRPIPHDKESEGTYGEPLFEQKQEEAV